MGGLLFHPCPIAPRLKFPLCHLLAVGLQTNPLPPPTSVFSSIKWYLHHRAAVRIIWDDTPEHYAQRGDGTCRRSWGSTVSGGPKSIPLEALLLPTAPRSPPPGPPPGGGSCHSAPRWEGWAAPGSGRGQRFLPPLLHRARLWGLPFWASSKRSFSASH